MKKALCVLLSILVLNSLNAQKPHLGFKGGLNMYNLLYKGGGRTDYKAGFNAGMLAHIHITNHFAIQPEVVYSRQGGIEKIRNIEHKLNLNYINVPVLAQYMFGKGYRIEAGPQVGFLVNAREKYSSPALDLNAKEAFKKVDYSLAVGFGYLTHTKIGFDVRWLFGLNNINQPDYNTTLPTYNNGGQLTLFYQFDHRGKK
jgi:hypothetical protein